MISVFAFVFVVLCIYVVSVCVCACVCVCISVSVPVVLVCIFMSWAWAVCCLIRFCLLFTFGGSCCLVSAILSIFRQMPNRNTNSMKKKKPKNYIHVYSMSVLFFFFCFFLQCDNYDEDCSLLGGLWGCVAARLEARFWLRFQYEAVPVAASHKVLWLLLLLFYYFVFHLLFFLLFIHPDYWPAFCFGPSHVRGACHAFCPRFLTRLLLFSLSLSLFSLF